MNDDEKDRAAFWNMIRMDPANDANRLVFADWCEERGDMELAEMLRGGSRKWIEDIAPAFEMDYQELMDHIKYDNCNTQYDAESWQDTWYEIKEDFFRHYKVMTGDDAVKETCYPFSCSC